MTGTERQIQAQIRAFLAKEGRNLAVEYASMSDYDTATGTATNTPSTVIVRGQIYPGSVRRQIPNSTSYATRTVQKCAIEAQGIQMPTNADFIVDGDDRYCIEEVVNHRGLLYQMVIEKA